MPRNRDNDEPRVVNFTMTGAVYRLGNGYMARADLAGVSFHGNRKPTAAEAAADLFTQLSQGNNPEAALALDLAGSGETYADVTRAMQANRLAIEEGAECGAYSPDEISGPCVRDRGHAGPHRYGPVPTVD